MSQLSSLPEYNSEFHTLPFAASVRTQAFICQLLWFLQHVLEALESHHALINGEALSQGVHGLEVHQDEVGEGANLVELVIPS